MTPPETERTLVLLFTKPPLAGSLLGQGRSPFTSFDPIYEGEAKFEAFSNLINQSSTVNNDLLFSPELQAGPILTPLQPWPLKFAGH